MKKSKNHEQLKIADQVTWQWLGRSIKGQILDIYFEKTVQTIKGKKITRNGSPDNPAVLVQSESGNQALKLMSELNKPSQNSLLKNKLKMFST